MKGVDFAETFSVQRVVRVFNINNKSFKVLAAATVCSFHLDLEPVIFLPCAAKSSNNQEERNLQFLTRVVCNVFFYVLIVH